MTNQSNYQNLNFEPRNPLLRHRVTPIILGCIVFSIAWFALPTAFLFVLLLVVIAVLLWMASYGWRDVLFELSRFLDRLQQF